MRTASTLSPPRAKTGRPWVDLQRTGRRPPSPRLALAAAVASLWQVAHATEIGSSTQAITLSPAGNPYTIAPGVVIDTRASKSNAISGTTKGTTWQLANAGEVDGGNFALRFTSWAIVENSGKLLSPRTTSAALYAGGNVTNFAGGVIAGKLDGVYASGAGSTVTNAGDILGDVYDKADNQAGVHLPYGGKVDNLSTGRIRAYSYGVWGAAGSTVNNDGLIQSAHGAAIDLTESGAGNSVVTNGGTLIGGGGTAVRFGGGDDTLVLRGGSSITGVVDGGAGSNALVLTGDTPGTFDVAALGPAAQYRGFSHLYKDGTGTWTLSSANTAPQAWQLDGGRLVVGGQLAGSITAPGDAGGRSIDIAPGARIDNAQGPAIVAGSNTVVTNAGTLSGGVRLTGAGNQLVLAGGSSTTGDLDGGGAPGNTLVLQGDGTLQSATYGFDTVAMNGHAWTLPGSVSTNRTALDSGVLIVNGTLASPAVDVARGAVLAGSGTVTGNVTVSGVLSTGDAVPARTPGLPVTLDTLRNHPDLPPLAVGTLRIDGSYRQLAGSAWLAEIGRDASDLLHVGGPATLEGGTVAARIRAASFSPTDSYRILSADGGVTGAFDGVFTANPFAHPTLRYEANDVYLDVTRGFQQAGGTPNERTVELALDRVVAGAARGTPLDADFRNVLRDLVNTDGAAAYAALDLLGPEAYTALPGAHFAAGQAGMDAMRQRLADRCAGGKSADRSCGSAVWATALGQASRTGGHDTWLGQDERLGGAMIGADHAFPTGTVAGIALGYAHATTGTDALPAHGTIDTYQLSLYGSHAAGALWAQGAAGYAIGNDRMRRQLPFSDTPRMAEGRSDSGQAFGFLRAGVDVQAGQAGVLAPFAGVEAQRVSLSGLTETGAGAADLNVARQSATALSSLLGAQWTCHLGTASVHAEVAWARQFGSLTRKVNATFTAAPIGAMTLYGASPDRDAARLALGATVPIGRHGEGYLRYDGQYGRRGSASMGSAGAAYRW